MALFKSGSFTSHSGLTLPFKIDCDAITSDDWDAIAAVMAPKLPDFNIVAGIPNGGLPFARAFHPYCKETGRLLIVDDVYTTGRSMAEAQISYPRGHEAIGLVLFARAPTPDWITPVFSLNPLFIHTSATTGSPAPT